MRSHIVSQVRPKRVPAILEPLEVKPRAVMVGRPEEVVVTIGGRGRLICVRPAYRVYEPPSVGDQIEAAVSDRLDQFGRLLSDVQKRAHLLVRFALSAFREVDGLLWGRPDHPRASWAMYGGIFVMALAIGYCLVMLARLELVGR